MPVFRTYAGSFSGSKNVTFFDFISGYLSAIVKEIPNAIKIELHPNNNCGFSESVLSCTHLILIDGAPRGIIEIGYKSYKSPRHHSAVVLEAESEYEDVPVYSALEEQSSLPPSLLQQAHGSFPKEKAEPKVEKINAAWWIQVRDASCSEAVKFAGYPDDFEGIEKAYKYLIQTLAKNNEQPISNQQEKN